MSDESSGLIQLGFVGAPFGVRGWIKLRSHTDPPERLLDHRSLRIGQGSVWQNYRIEASGRSGGALTVKLSGVEDRDQAQALRGSQVCVPRTTIKTCAGVSMKCCTTPKSTPSIFTTSQPIKSAR